MTNYKVNGVDLNKTFSKYGGGTKAASTNLYSDGTDLCEIFHPISGSITTQTGFKSNGTDIGTLFAPVEYMRITSFAEVPSSLGQVYILKLIGTTIYVGGNFTSFSGTTFNRIAKWDTLTSTWSALDSGLTGDCFQIETDGTYLYVGGNFTSVGPSNTICRGIARWHLTNNVWSSLVFNTNIGLGTAGTPGICYAIAVYGTKIYVGGSFTTAGGVTNTANLAFWDTTNSSWNSLGAVPNNACTALHIKNNILYVVGWFSSISTTPTALSVNYIVSYNLLNSTWSAMGAGITGGGSTTNRQMATFASDNTYLYLGGIFTIVGGVANTSKIARWHLTDKVWSSFGTGLGNVYAITFVNNIIYIAGELYGFGALLRWNGLGWVSNIYYNTEKMQSGGVLLSGGTVYYPESTQTLFFNNPINTMLCDSNLNIYVGGLFGGQRPQEYFNKVIQWNGSKWINLDKILYNIAAYTLSSDGKNLYAGGFQLTGMQSIYLGNIAKWNGSTWSSLGSGLDYKVYVLVSNGSDLYAGGDFNNSGTISCNFIAKWNGSSWAGLSTGLNGICYAIAIYGTNIYVGGTFTMAGTTSCSNIAMWDGSNWFALGTGLNSSCNSLLIIGTKLYAGGSFSLAGSTSCNCIAVWNITTPGWSTLGTGLTLGSGNRTCKTLTTDGTYLYAGGIFTNAGSVVCNNIARWHLTNNGWTSLSTGFNAGDVGTCNSLAVNQNIVYACGIFTTAGGITAYRVAQWNTTTSIWSPLDNGVSAEAYSIVIYNNSLYMSGTYTSNGRLPFTNTLNSVAKIEL